jgi:deoxyribodipyrimidine photolyase-related protein
MAGHIAAARNAAIDAAGTGQSSRGATRRVVIVLGDQLDADAKVFRTFDPCRDAVWMAEVAEESTNPLSSKPRTALFLSAMRHFAQALTARGRTVHYVRLDDPGNRGSLAAELAAAIARLRPQELAITRPGDWRVLQSLKAVGNRHGLDLNMEEDCHFYASVDEFAAHAKGRKQLRMEYFYREMRRRHAVLMEGEKPVGGRWNYDPDNREAFPKDGPGDVPVPARFAPDRITREVIALVNDRFAGHPGELSGFAWPVTRERARDALAHFVAERLPHFGRWQDAMWPGEAWLWHSHLAAALNLKLLNPREVVAATEVAYRAGAVPLASAEGFIRQVIGWREFVRGIYWTQMPGYLERNALGAREPLPGFYWTGRTPMTCLADAIGQTLRHGYAHHIQRLMVTGLYALLLGVDPKAVHAWYLAVYVDAVEWVELPNTLGMSQAADGGLLASKPYIASGKYIQRMSGGSLCARCRFDPKERTGARACPFTTLYWDYLMRHERMLSGNPRTVMQTRNLARISPDERKRIAARAAAIRAGDRDER